MNIFTRFPSTGKAAQMGSGYLPHGLGQQGGPGVRFTEEKEARQGKNMNSKSHVIEIGLRTQRERKRKFCLLP